MAAKVKPLSSAALEKLKIKYARPQSMFEEFSGADYIKRIASSIGSEFNVKVTVSAGASCVDVGTQVVNLNEAQVYKHGDDFAVGLVLHEVGHLKFTPRDNKYRDGWHHELHNLLEDVRMEAIVKNEYAGAHYFIDTLNDQAIEKITEAAMREPDMPRETRNSTIEKQFYTVIQHAIARAHGADTSAALAAHPAMDVAAHTLTEYMLASESASASECIALAIKARELMDEFINPPKPEPQPQQAPQSGAGAQDEKGKPEAKSQAQPQDGKEQKDGPANPSIKPPQPSPQAKPEPQHDIRPAVDKVRLMARIEGGGSTSGDGWQYSRHDDEPTRYERNDTQAKMFAGNLKRRIIQKLRANDRSKVVTNQCRGRLNKKAIAKAVINDSRIYQRRMLPKRRRYVASVILDTSGSMWNAGNQRIDLAMQSTAMMVRTLRALGVPTALSIYGAKSSERVSHADRYLVPEVSRDMAGMSRAYYHASHTNTDDALKEQLPKLQRAAHGREQLLIIITDGAVSDYVGRNCRAHIASARKHGTVHPMVFYVETRKAGSTLLNNPKEERHVASAAELPQAAADMLAAMSWHN